MKSQNEEHFVKLYKPILSRRDLIPADKLVYAVIADRLRLGIRQSSRRSIAKVCGMGTATVTRSISRLTGLGMLQVNNVGNGRAARYSIPAEKRGKRTHSDTASDDSSAPKRKAVSKRVRSTTPEELTSGIKMDHNLYQSDTGAVSKWTTLKREERGGAQPTHSAEEETLAAFNGIRSQHYRGSLKMTDRRRALCRAVLEECGDLSEVKARAGRYLADGREFYRNRAHGLDVFAQDVSKFATFIGPPAEATPAVADEPDELRDLIHERFADDDALYGELNVAINRGVIQRAQAFGLVHEAATADDVREALNGKGRAVANG